MTHRILEELKLLYHICFAKNRGQNHKERMENYFGPQAKAYDSFRKRLLHGREDIYKKLPTPQDGIWVELGGGTGQCLEFLGDRIHKLKKVYLVDLSPSLLAITKQRCADNNWDNVECIEGDASQFSLPENEKADVITLCYSLTMIPPWFQTLNQCKGLLKDSGYLAVIDFYLARKRPLKKVHPDQKIISRIFWPLFFMGDDVILNADHLAYLNEYFNETHFNSSKGRIPYTPLKAPYYQFIGQPKKIAVQNQKPTYQELNQTHRNLDV
jgi:S-adenosylmethionine-diacylgycerolhomoserine-N-methlytransferase